MTATKQFFATLIMMMIGHMASWAEEITYDFSASIPSAWTLKGETQGFETTGYSRGSQFNVGKGPTASLTLKGVKDVTKIVVTCSANVVEKNSIAVTVGNESWGSVKLGKETNAEKTFTGNASEGEVVVNIALTEKSLWISKITVTGTKEDGNGGETETDTDTLDPLYIYGEPTIIGVSGEECSNSAYSFVQNNIRVSTTVGAQNENYFGCNATGAISFTAARPIKAIVINGYIKKDFDAEVDFGQIVYADASEDYVEANPVVVITDVDHESVTINCAKQLRCYSVEVYFEENPDVEIDNDGGDEEELSYDYEPTEVGNFNLVFDEMEKIDYTDFIGLPYTELYLYNDDYELDIAVNSSLDENEELPLGVYEVSMSDDDDTVVASPGGDDYYDYPTCLLADFEYLEDDDSWVYLTAYYLMSGRLTVSLASNASADVPNVIYSFEGTSYNGSTIRAIYSTTGDLSSVATVPVAVSHSDGKYYHSGRIVIRRADRCYTSLGRHIR